MRKISSKQLIAINTFVDSGNIRGAAKASGYTPAYVGRLLRDDMVKAEVSRIMAERAGMTKDDLISKLKDIIEKDGPNARDSDKIRAVEAMAKLQGWNEPDKLDVRSEVLKTDLETQIAMSERLIIEHGGKVLWPDGPVKNTKKS